MKFLKQKYNISLFIMFFTEVLFAQNVEWNIFPSCNDISKIIGTDSLIYVGTSNGILVINKSKLSYSLLNSNNSLFKNTNINDMVLDKDNNLWIITGGYVSRDGVYKYDGKNWIGFTEQNGAIKGKLLRVLAVNKRNQVFVPVLENNSSKLLVFEKDKIINEIILPYVNNEPFYPNAIGIDSNNVIWVGAHNYIGRYFKNNWVIFNKDGIGLNSNFTIFEINSDKENKMLFGGFNSGFIKYDGMNWEIFNELNSPLPSNSVRSLYVDKNNNYYLGMGPGNYPQGLVIIRNGKWEIINKNNSKLPTNAVVGTLLREDGSLWIGTDYYGIGIYDKGNWQRYFLKGKFYSEYISKIEFSLDNEMLLFFGSTHIQHYKKYSLKYIDNPYLIEKTPRVGLEAFFYLNHDNNDNYWFFHEEHGLVKYKNYEWINVLIPNIDNENIWIYGLEFLNNGFIILLRDNNNNYKLMKQSKNKWNEISLPKSFNDIFFLLIDHEERIWLIDRDKDNVEMFLYNNSQWTIFNKNNFMNVPENMYVFDIRSIKLHPINHGIYCAVELRDNISGSYKSSIYGILRFRNNKWEYLDPKKELNISNKINIEEEPSDVFVADNKLWAGFGSYIISIDNSSENSWHKLINLSDFLQIGNDFRVIDMMIKNNILWIATWPPNGLMAFKLDDLTYIQDKKDKIPSNFLLSQNYPNPFNPSTKITYVLPKQLHVTLKIFDVLGKEIRTLVNKEQLPGEYKVDFNASNLPSGIYFYRLQAGDFIKTRKMILLK